MVVTRYRRTMQLQAMAELNKTTANVSAFTPTQMTVTSSGTGVRAQSDFWGGDVTTSFSPVTAGRAVAVTVNVTNAGTAPYVQLIQDGNILTSAVASSTSNSLTLTATPPTSSPLTLYVGVYEASPNDFTIGEVVYKVYSEATEAYVTKACNVDTAFSEDYKFGFNGQMKDNEVQGNGNNLEFTFRTYDSRLGRFLSLDLLSKRFPFYSTYQFAGNTPIMAKDLEGLEPGIVIGSAAQVQSVNDANKLIKKGDQNWSAFKLSTMDQAILSINNHKNLGNKVFVVYYQTHGMCGEIPVLPGENGSIETMTGGDRPPTDDKNFSFEYSARLIQGTDYYNRHTDPTERENAKIEYDAAEEAFSPIKALANTIEDGGTLIFGGCMSFGCGDGSGDKFMLNISSLLNNRIHVVGNRDFTSELGNVLTPKGWEQRMLDAPRTDPANFNYGWITEKDFNTNKNLYLNSQKNKPIYELKQESKKKK